MRACRTRTPRAGSNSPPATGSASSARRSPKPRRRPVKGCQGPAARRRLVEPAWTADALYRSDRVQHLSAVHQRILWLERVGEPVELLEPRISIVLAVLGVTGNLYGDDVLDDFITPVGAEGNTGDPGAEEGAPLLVLAPARQLALGEQPLVLCGLLGTDVDDDDVQLTHDGGSLGCPGVDLGDRPAQGQSVVRRGRAAARACSRPAQTGRRGGKLQGRPGRDRRRAAGREPQ